MSGINSLYLVKIDILITIRIELHSFLHFFHCFLNIWNYNKTSSWWPCASSRTVENSRTVMNVEPTLSRSASFVSSIIDPSAFFVHFFNSFLLILKIPRQRWPKKVSDWDFQISRSCSTKLYLQNRLRWRRKQKNPWNHHQSKSNWTNEFYCWPSDRLRLVDLRVIPKWPMTLWLWPLLIYLVESSTASWKFFISPCDLCVYRSIPALKFLLKAVSNFSYLRLKKYA